MNTQPILDRARGPLAAALASLLIVAGTLTATPARADDAVVADQVVAVAETVDAPSDAAPVEAAPEAGAAPADADAPAVPQEPTTSEPAAIAPAAAPAASVASVAVPTVTVSKTEGLDPSGETVTITGSGFVADAPATTAGRPPLAGSFAGAYVIFGKFADTWRPSEGAPSSARKVLAQKWAVLEADLGRIGGVNAGGVVVSSEGTFETTLTLSRDEASELLAGNYGIYTYPGSGATYAPFETYTPIAFAEDATGPAIDVTVAKATAAAGATVVVTGTRFDGVVNAYAAIIEKGTEAEVDTDGGYVAFGFWADGIVDGDFEKTLVAPTAKLDRTKQYEVIVWQQHTAPSSDSIYARADVPLTAADWTALFPGGGPAPVDPVTPVTPVKPQGAGSMSWGISSGFVNYITGSVARGDISVGGGATRSGGVFQFGQAAGGDYDPATGTGTVSYVGSVRFSGHHGTLNVSIADPQVRITSPNAATLYIRNGGSQVAFATLNLGAAVRTTVNGAVTYSRVPASLTSAGLNGVLQGFATTLDPVTFTIGAPAPAPAGAAGTVASAAPAAAARPIPATAPATSGIELDDTQLEALAAGEEVTISVGGFQPSEPGIRVVVYSTPVLLGEVTANAAGVATWTGTLPATLADGEHTLTFQGSVDRGIRFTLARADKADEGCVVEGADLRWGFKESFRATSRAWPRAAGS